MKYVAFVLFVGLAALGLGQSAQAWPSVHSVEHRSYALSAKGVIAVQNASGDIRVTGWDRDQVELTITKTSWSSDDLPRLNVEVASDSDAMSVRAVYPSDCTNCDISLVLRVPRAAQITADAASGDVAVDTIAGGVRVDTASGDIKLKNVLGLAHLHASSGDITIDGSGAPVDAAASSGDIKASNLQSDINLVASSGDVKADFSRFDAVHTVRIASNSGSIELDVPRGSGFKVEASTNSGSIESNLQLPIRDRDSGATVSAQVGSGAAAAQLRTTSGDINITMH